MRNGRIECRLDHPRNRQQAVPEPVSAGTSSSASWHSDEIRQVTNNYLSMLELNTKMSVDSHNKYHHYPNRWQKGAWGASITLLCGDRRQHFRRSG